MARRHSAAEEEEEEGSGELNLTPYLDIITTLVIFLIFSFQVVLEFRLIELLPPAIGKGSSNSAKAEKPREKVTLAVTVSGYKLLTANGALPPVEIPKRNGEYDTATLQSTLISWKEQLGLQNSIILVAEDNIAYAEVVKTMDAIRTKPDNTFLFPDVLFGKAMGG